MNLLVRAVYGLRRLATPNAFFGLAVAGFLLAVEVLGRQSRNDLYDLLSVIALGLVAMLVYARHRRSPFAWVDAAKAGLSERLDGLKGWAFQMGLDMRGQPPVKRGAPPIVVLIGSILAVATVVLLFTGRWLPHGIRGVMLHVSYVVYVFGLSLFWALLIAAILFAAFIPLAVIHDSYVSAHRGPARRSRRPESGAVAVYFGLLFCLGVVLPIWVAPVACVVLCAVYMLGTIPPREFSVQFLWRPKGSIRVRALTWSQWVCCEFVVIGLTVLALTLAACGGLIQGREDAVDAMPLTCLMGLTLAWLSPGLLGLLCVQMVLGRFRDPSRPTVPRLHVTDSTRALSRRSLRRQAAQRGWKARFGAARPLDVQVRVVAEKSDDRPHSGPTPATPDDFSRDGFFVRLARRDEQQKRRRFLGGLESMLKQARLRSRGGSGYWLAPHFWFVSGLMRDSRPGEEDFDLGEDPILNPSRGKPYHRAFPQPVRHHLYRVLRGTQVDLIFVEDGVSFRRLRRILRALFEVYDVHGGRKAAEEIDFRGLPGVKVVIHDFQFDEPFQSRTYPEPKYDFLGRARILHVFRDRGGQDELVEPPFDFGRRPAPVGMF